MALVFRAFVAPSSKSIPALFALTVLLSLALAGCGRSITDTPTATTAPQITTQPQSQTVDAGTTASFTVAATGTEPLSYQWSRNGTAINGAAQASYTTAATSSADNGAQFTVTVSNAAGSVTSQAATLTVNTVATAPTITTQPASQSVTVGAAATFTVVATGTAPLSYQWSENGANIAGATSASYTTPATASGDNGATFKVLVSNSAGSATSNTATLTVTAAVTAPTITTQPASQSVTAGSMATFTVVATGTAPLSYQWSKNGTNITGATTASYTTPATVSGDSGATFKVVVSNSAGSVTSNAATLTVTTPIIAPAITTQPAAQSVTVGATATFSVIATGTAPLAYQWSKNGASISGATSASYTTPATVSGDNGASFAVVVSNSAGSATSNAAILTVTSATVAPTITTQPGNQTVTVGATATFTVVATGTAPLSYQWSKSGTNISGATSASYTTPATVSGDNGATFVVVVSNSAGNATSNSATLTVQAATPGVDVITYHNDVARTGQNLAETTLTKTNVNQSTFGLLRKFPVDGKVDAQPLVLSQFSIGGSLHNVAFVATEHGTVYAFDINTGTALWQVSMLGAGETPSDDHSCNQITPEIGVTATPVIDRTAGRMYLVATSKDGSGNYHHRVHALNLTTGADVMSATEVSASIVAGPDVPVTSSGNIVFMPAQYAERSALLLLNGVIYTSWTSHCDTLQYTGWVLAYNTSDLSQAAIYNDEPDGNYNSNQGEGAFWNSGDGPAADSTGNIYVASGNGHFDTTLVNGKPSGADYGNSLIKLAPPSSGTLPVLDYFTMYNTATETNNDQDLASGGVMLIPDQSDSSGGTKHLVVAAGKDHNIYLLDRDGLGGWNPTDNSNAYQAFNAFSTPDTSCGTSHPGIFGSPVYFNGTIYYSAANDLIRTFPFTNALLPTAGTQSTPSSEPFCFPGATMAISANGTSNGILWATQNSSSQGVLHAFDADNIATELYNSATANDQYGPGSKWTVPTIANGFVLVGTQASGGVQNYVAVFGLK